MLALAIISAELRIGRMTVLWGPGGNLNYGAKADTSFFTRVGLGGRIGGRARVAPSERIRPCYLRSS